MTNATKIQVKIQSFENDNVDPRIDEIFNFDIMYEDYMEKIEKFYVAYLDGEMVGFQAVGYLANKTILIQVKDALQGQGIGSQLVAASGSFEPKQNGCKKFWSRMKKIHG
jgi:N-acetylglutamate synthase-like GNAT family acetyltransferase